MADIDLKSLLQELEKDPTNLDLINSVAIGYFENYDQKTDKEDYDYFEKAYLLKKTVKSTHNFAWFLCFECGENERAFQIQEECLELKPKSYYPYYQYGLILSYRQRDKEAIPFLKRAYEIENRGEIAHRIGFCHFHINQFEEAKKYFLIADIECDRENNINPYNVALTEWKLNNVDQVRVIADKLFKQIQEGGSFVGYSDVGFLYFLLEDFQRASECLMKDVHIDLGRDLKLEVLLECDHLSYSLYVTDNKLWREKINNSIVDLENRLCTGIANSDPDWSTYSEEDKKERLDECAEELMKGQELLKNGMTKPIPDIIIYPESVTCLLFDCKQHENKAND